MIRPNEIRSSCNYCSNISIHEPLWNSLQVATCIWMYWLLTDYTLHINNGFNIVDCWLSSCVFTTVSDDLYQVLWSILSYILVFNFQFSQFSLMKTLAPQNSSWHCLNSKQHTTVIFIMCVFSSGTYFIYCIWFCSCFYLSIILFFTPVRFALHFLIVSFDAFVFSLTI